ncbi:MAG: hypothetical protein AB2L20_14835 [Mangrovibacterium sp.]
MTLLDVIKAACKTKGVPEKHAERIKKAYKVEKAEDAEKAIDSFKEDLLPAIQEAETAAEAAKKKAEQDAVAEYEKKHGLKDGKPAKADDPTPAPKLDPEIAKIIEAQNKTIEELKGLVQNNVKTVASAEKIASAKDLVEAKANTLKSEEAKVKFRKSIAKIQLDGEKSIEEQVNEMYDDFIETQQLGINELVASGQYTPGFQALTERTQEEWTKLMDVDTKTANPGVVDLGISK